MRFTPLLRPNADSVFRGKNLCYYFPNYLKGLPHDKLQGMSLYVRVFIPMKSHSIGKDVKGKGKCQESDGEKKMQIGIDAAKT